MTITNAFVVEVVYPAAYLVRGAARTTLPRLGNNNRPKLSGFRVLGLLGIIDVEPGLDGLLSCPTLRKKTLKMLFRLVVVTHFQRNCYISE